MIRNTYLIPRLDECIDSLHDAMILSTLDANLGYWQVEIIKRDHDKMALISHNSLLCFTRMLFGLENSPGTFQGPMDVLQTKVK